MIKFIHSEILKFINKCRNLPSYFFTVQKKKIQIIILCSSRDIVEEGARKCSRMVFQKCIGMCISRVHSAEYVICLFQELSGNDVL